MPAILSIVFGGAFTLAAAWALGALLLRRLAAPQEVRLAIGAVALSTAIFLLLLAGAFDWRIVLGAGAAALAAGWRMRRAAAPDGVHAPRLAAAVLGVYGVYALVNALAPETVADGVTYHLGLVSEYVRTGGFADRIAFYEMTPQGIEMLFAAAFAFGRHSAAKLVEFGLLVATAPLLLRVASRLGAPPLAAGVAAVFYFCAPVVGITGASSYTDAGQVFFALASFYLLLLWRDSGDARYLFPAGLLAGFCYAVKMPGLMAPAAACGWLLATRRWKALALFGAGAALAMAPWLARSFALTGNPFAPLLNAFFPNPYFHIATERDLAADLRSLQGVAWALVPWELAIGGKFTGSFGPLLLAAPLMLAGWRERGGRLCCALAAVLALPWLANTGARFLMLSIPFVALGVGIGAARLGAGVAWTAIATQALLCFPPVVGLYEPRYGFRLREFPVRAALRMEPEPQYLAARLDEYKVAGLLERNTPKGARILALLSVANAYVDREVAVPWQSAEGDRLLDTLRVAGLYGGYPLYEVRGEWAETPLKAVRLRLPRANPNEWCVHEFELYAAVGRVAAGRQWTLNAWPNPWETPFALDRNVATRWRTWEPMRAGMFIEIELDRPQRLTGAAALSHTPVFGVPMEFYGRTPEERWLALGAARSQETPKQDLRRAATHALRQAGFRYLLTPLGAEGNGPIGDAIAGREAEWGLEPAGQAGNVRLFRLP